MLENNNPSLHCTESLKRYDIKTCWLRLDINEMEKNDLWLNVKGIYNYILYSKNNFEFRLK